MFRLNTQHVFVTYSQVGDRTVESLREFLRSLSAPVEKFVIGLESHEDGGRHMHVYLVFASRYDSRNERFLDWDGVHPNIQKVKGRLDGADAKRVYDYATKDGDVHVWPEGSKFEFRSGGKVSKFAALNSASSAQEALSLLAEISPRDYFGNRERFEYGFSRHFAPPEEVFTSHFDPDSFAPCEVLQSWVRDNLWYVVALVVDNVLMLFIGAPSLTAFALNLSSYLAHLEQARQAGLGLLDAMCTLPAPSPPTSSSPDTPIMSSMMLPQSPSPSSACGNSGSVDNGISLLPESMSSHLEFQEVCPGFFV